MSDDMNDEAKPAKRRAINAKAIAKIAAQINAMTDPVAARRRRRKLGDRLIAQIASEEVKNPVAAAKAFVAAFDKAPDSEPEAATDSGRN